LAYGLRSVDGSENNLLTIGGFNQTEFGAADTTFPRLLKPVFQTADVQPAGFFGPGSPAGTTPTSYAQTSGSVFDADPRVISNLIVDQTANNPAVAATASGAVSAAALVPTIDFVQGQPLTGSSAPPTTNKSSSSQRDAGFRRHNAVQRLDDVLWPVLRSRPRSGDQRRFRHDLHSAAAG
jgi:hypothetical protein